MRLKQLLTRPKVRRPQYRLRLESGRCLTYYETGQHGEKARRGDLILAIYGSLDHANRWCERYNNEWAWLGLKATVWAYWGSKPLGVMKDGAIESEGDRDPRLSRYRVG